MGVIGNDSERKISPNRKTNCFRTAGIWRVRNVYQLKCRSGKSSLFLSTWGRKTNSFCKSIVIYFYRSLDISYIPLMFVKGSPQLTVFAYGIFILRFICHWLFPPCFPSPFKYNRSCFQIAIFVCLLLWSHVWYLRANFCLVKIKLGKCKNWRN